jgi:nitrite reductase/ring-hydroxylating ferredoxin subunit
VAKLVEVARLEDIPLQRGLTIELTRCAIALFNARGRICAIDAACIRCASLLAAGDVRGDVVACPGCGWQYDVTTGRLPAIPRLCVDTYEVKMVGSRVMVCDPFADS